MHVPEYYYRIPVKLSGGKYLFSDPSEYCAANENRECKRCKIFTSNQ